MPKWIRTYVRVITAVNYRVGRVAMYFIFVKKAILQWSSISKIFLEPSLVTQEPANSTATADSRIYKAVVRVGPQHPTQTLENRV